MKGRFKINTGVVTYTKKKAVTVGCMYSTVL